MNTTIQKIPGYFTTQIHPENSVLLSLIKIGEQFVKANFQLEELEKLRQSLSQEDLLGYTSALNYIENHLLLEDPTQLTVEKFLLEIKKINWLVIQNVCGRGEFRSVNLIVWNDAIMPKSELRNTEIFKQIDQYILTACQAEQKKLWELTRQKVWQVASEKIPSLSAPFTDPEKDLMRGLAGFPPAYSEVPNLMNQFARDLLHKIQEKEDTVTLMAWTHQNLIKIHPFIDGNGRTARLMMNLIGMWSGKKPLLIVENAAYNTASRTLDPEKFADYLRRLETQQLNIDELVERTLRNMYEQYCKPLDWSIVKFAFANLK
jgi:Fic family protein